MDGRIRLAWKGSYDDDQDFMERAYNIDLGISYDMLLDALSEARGSTRLSGLYPIDNTVHQRSMKLLWKDRRRTKWSHLQSMIAQGHK